MLHSELEGGAGRMAAPAYEASLKSMRRVVLMTLYVTYGCFYLSRKADSVAKIALHEREGFTVEDLAMLDTVYLFVYTVSLAASGMLSGRFPAGRLLAVGLVGLAATSFVKSHMTSPMGFAVCQVFHAFFQSAGWPTCIKLIGVWVTENRGFVMGIWTTCQSLGGILGAVWATYFLSHYGWPYAYLYHVPLMLGLALVCLVLIRDEPPSTHDSVSSGSGAGGKAGSLGGKSLQGDGSQPVTFWNVVLIPGVVSIGVAYFFLKFLRYALLMWLPYYYEEGLHMDVSVAGYMSSSFETGGLIGTPLIGWFSDQVFSGRRDLTAAWFLAGAAVMLFMCVVVADFGVTLNALCMFLVGILVIGPDSILSGTIAQDLGSTSAMGPKAIGTLAGLINSVGSCGSIFQSYATAFISRVYGWPTLFAIFVSCAFTSSMILFMVAARMHRPPPSRHPKA